MGKITRVRHFWQTTIWLKQCCDKFIKQRGKGLSKIGKAYWYLQYGWAVFKSPDVE